MPVLPLACAAVGCAMARIESRQAVRAVGVFVLLIGGLSATQVNSLTMRDVGFVGAPQNASAWGRFANANPLLIVAGKQHDICGLRSAVARLAQTGGFTYLHKNVPLYPPGAQVASRNFNYVIDASENTSGWDKIVEDHGAALYRIPNLTCVADAHYSWTLP